MHPEVVGVLRRVVRRKAVSVVGRPAPSFVELQAVEQVADNRLHELGRVDLVGEARALRRDGGRGHALAAERIGDQPAGLDGLEVVAGGLMEEAQPVPVLVGDDVAHDPVVAVRQGEDRAVGPGPVEERRVDRHVAPADAQNRRGRKRVVGHEADLLSERDAPDPNVAPPGDAQEALIHLRVIVGDLAIGVPGRPRPGGQGLAAELASHVAVAGAEGVLERAVEHVRAGRRDSGQPPDHTVVGEAVREVRRRGLPRRADLALADPDRVVDGVAGVGVVRLELGGGQEAPIVAGARAIGQGQSTKRAGHLRHGSLEQSLAGPLLFVWGGGPRHARDERQRHERRSAGGARSTPSSHPPLLSPSHLEYARSAQALRAESGA